MSQEAQQEVERTSLIPDRVLPFVGPRQLPLRHHVAIMEDLIRQHRAPDESHSLSHRAKELEPLPKILVIGTDEPALKATEQLLLAGFAVVVAEEDARPQSLTHVGEEKAKWGLQVLSHPHAVALMNKRFTVGEVNAAGFSGVVLSHEIAEPQIKTPVDMSIPLVIPAESVLVPGYPATDIEHKIANPNTIRGERRFGRAHNGSLGRIGITGEDPVQAVEAAHRVALIHLVDAAARKYGVGPEYFRFDALTQGNVQDVTERLGMAPGEVGVTTLIAPNTDAMLDGARVTREMLEQNRITLMNNAHVTGTIASPSPEIVHVSVSKAVSSANIFDTTIGLSGLVIADGSPVNRQISPFTVPTIRVGEAHVGNGRNELRAVEEFAEEVRRRGKHPNDRVIATVQEARRNGAAPIEYVADWLVSTTPIFWNGHMSGESAHGKKGQEEALKAKIGHDVPETLLPFLSDPEDRMGVTNSLPDVAAALWTQSGVTYQGRAIASYKDWREAKTHFEQEAGHVRVAILGGTAFSYELARHVRECFPNAHVVIFEPADHVGGGDVSALSPFAHTQGEKVRRARIAIQAIMDPGIDVITSFQIRERDIPYTLKSLNVGVTLDARVDQDVAPAVVPDGKKILSAADFRRLVYQPFDRDGHMGAVSLPSIDTSRGPSQRGFIMANGKTGLEFLQAAEVVRTVDDIERKWGVPRALIDAHALLNGGLLKNRTDGLGFKYLSHGETTMLVPNWLEAFPASALGVDTEGVSPRDRDLQKKIIAAFTERQKENGGFFVGNTTIGNIRPQDDGGLLIQLVDPRNKSQQPASASFIVSAMEPHQHKAIPGAIMMTQDRWDDLPGDVISQLEKAIQRVPRSGAFDNEQFQNIIVAHQIGRGQRWTDSSRVDPIVHYLQNGPQALLAQAAQKEEPPVVRQESTMVFPPVSVDRIPNGRNDLLDALAAVQSTHRQQIAEEMHVPVEPLGLPVPAPRVELPQAAYESRAFTSPDVVRDTVHERRQAHVRAMVLTNLRDILVTRAREGGYADPRDVGLPGAERLNMLMNLTEEDIVLHTYNTGKHQVGGDDEFRSAEYILLRLRQQRGVDETLDLHMRMLDTGEFQQRGTDGRWHTLRTVNSLRRALVFRFGRWTQRYDGDGFAYMAQFRTRLRAEQGLFGLWYMQEQLRAMGENIDVTDDRFSFLFGQLEVSRSGNIIATRRGRDGHIEREMLLSNRAVRRAISRLLATERELPSHQEQMIDDAKDFMIRYQYTASLVLGLFAKAGLAQIVSHPEHINGLAGTGVAWGVMMNRLMARVKHGYAQGSVDFKVVQVMEHLTGHVAAFGMGLILSEPVGGWFDRFMGTDTVGTELHNTAVTHEPNTSASLEPSVTFSPSELQSTDPVMPASDVPSADVAVSTPAVDVSAYHGQWQTQMVEMMQKLGGTEGWMNTVDQNGVSQAEVMSHWRILLEGKISDSDLARLIDQIGGTKDIAQYMHLRESLLVEVQALLRQ